MPVTALALALGAALLHALWNLGLAGARDTEATTALRYADPIAYLELVMVVPAVAYGAATFRGRGAAAMRAAATPRTVAIAVGMFSAYALTLAALELASAASVAAVRESSVVIATALAGLALKEAVTRRRLAGAVVVVAGIALLAAA